MTHKDAAAVFPHRRHFPDTKRLGEPFKRACTFAASLGLAHDPAKGDDPDDMVTDGTQDGIILPGADDDYVPPTKVPRYLLGVTLYWRDRVVSPS